MDGSHLSPGFINPFSLQKNNDPKKPVFSQQESFLEQVLPKRTKNQTKTCCAAEDPLVAGLAKSAELQKQRREASSLRWAQCQDHKTWLEEKNWRKQVRFLGFWRDLGDLKGGVLVLFVFFLFFLGFYMVLLFCFVKDTFWYG